MTVRKASNRTRRTSKRTSSQRTQAEVAAYNQGKAFGAATSGGRVELRTKKERDSFRKGVDAAKRALKPKRTRRVWRRK